MKRSSCRRGFSLAEVMVAMVASVLVIGALFTGSIGLQKTAYSSERFATDQSDQRLLMDFLSRDLRRAIGIATVTGLAAPVRLESNSATVENQTDLVITLPAYYKSNVPADAGFDDPLPVIASGDRTAYGDASGPAPSFPVTFRKLFVGEEGCVCFVRQEAAAKRVLIRHADDLHVRLTVAPDGKSCALQTWFAANFGRERPSVTAFDRVMLRNLRVD